MSPKMTEISYATETIQKIRELVRKNDFDTAYAMLEEDETILCKHYMQAYNTIKNYVIFELTETL